VEPDEELCIYYGPNLWFKPSGLSDASEHPCAGANTDADADLVDDNWIGLTDVRAEASNDVPDDAPDLNEILLDEDLPFNRVKLTSDEDDEETLETIRTGEHIPRLPARLLMSNTKVQAWAVDIPDPRYITSALKYISPFSFTSTIH
jgi:tRNA-specific adenosine deaminase 3